MSQTVILTDIEFNTIIERVLEMDSLKDKIVLTDEQIATAFDAILEMGARQADIYVVKMLGASVNDLAEYMWDHWMGEPDTPSVEDVEAMIIEALNL